MAGTGKQDERETLYGKAKKQRTYVHGGHKPDITRKTRRDYMTQGKRIERGYSETLVGWKPSVQKFWIELLYHREDSVGICKLEKPETKSRQNVRSRQCAFLKRGGYIVQVAPRTYLLNPSFYVPPPGAIVEAVELWNDHLTPGHKPLKMPGKTDVKKKYQEVD